MRNNDWIKPHSQREYCWRSDGTYQLSSSCSPSSTSRSSTESKAESSSRESSLSQLSFWQLYLYNIPSVEQGEWHPDFKWSSLILASMANDRLLQFLTSVFSVSFQVLQYGSELPFSCTELFVNSLQRWWWFGLVSNSSGGWLQIYGLQSPWSWFWSSIFLIQILKSPLNSCPYSSILTMLGGPESDKIGLNLHPHQCDSLQFQLWFFCSAGAELCLASP